MQHSTRLNSKRLRRLEKKVRKLELESVRIGVDPRKKNGPKIR